MQQIKYPDYIYICRFPYRLVFIKDLKDASGEDIFGMVDYEQSKIVIKAGMAPSITAQSLFHECLHAMFIQMGNPQQLTEGVVDALSYSLIAFLNENPSLC